jgi:hypothetical protein
MTKFEILDEVKDAIIMEGAWLSKTSNWSEDEKEDILEVIKVVWNRAFLRVATGYDGDLIIYEDDFKKVWGGEDE